MKKLIGTMLFVVFLFNTNAQENLYTIKGKLVDEKTNEPIVGATICLEKNCVVSNLFGEFTLLKKYPNGKYTISFSSIGYLKKIIKLKVTDKDVALNETLLEAEKKILENLEVTSIRANDKSPYAKTNLNKIDIEKTNQGQDLPYALNQTPNVVTTTDAGNGVGYTGIRIRGSDATRINVTLNGIPFNDAESHGSFFVNMPDMLSSVNSIQVQRGIGTSSNGTAAFGATINLSTNDNNKLAKVELNNSYGSFNTFKNTVKANSGLINNCFTLDARLSQITSDGYIDRATSNLKAFALTGTYFGNNSSLKMNIFSGKEKTYQAWNGIDEATLKSNRTFNSSGTDKPGEPYYNETDNYNQTHYQLLFNKTINQNFSYNISSFYTRGFGYYENYSKNQVYANYGLSSSLDTANLVTQLWLDNHFYGNIFNVQYKKNNNTITFGGSWTNYDGKHYGFVTWAEKGGFEPNQKYYNLTANKRERSAYTKLQHSIGKGFEVYVDIQYRYVQHQMPGFRKNVNLMVDRTFNFINPKVGLSYNHKNHEAFFSYANASKEPNRDDFEAALTNQPKAEQLHDFELGYTYKNKNYNLGINLYYMLYKDQLIVTGKVNDVGAYNRTNVDKSYRMGVELNGNWQINKWLQLSGNIAFSQNKINTYTQFFDEYDANWNWIGQAEKMYNNTNIALSPSLVSSHNISCTAIKNIELQLVGKYIGKQYLDNTETEARSLESFYTQDFKAFIKIPNKVFTSTQIVFSLNNIFNTLYVPNGYTFASKQGNDIFNYNYYLPACGRNFMLSLNVGF